MTFEEWFEQEFVPSFAYSGADPEQYRYAAWIAWETAMEIGYERGHQQGLHDATPNWG